MSFLVPLDKLEQMFYVCRMNSQAVPSILPLPLPGKGAVSRELNLQLNLRFNSPSVETFPGSIRSAKNPKKVTLIPPVPRRGTRTPHRQSGFRVDNMKGPCPAYPGSIRFYSFFF